MSFGAQLAIGLSSALALLWFLKEDEAQLSQLKLLVAGLVYGALLAVILFSNHGWVSALISLPGFILYLLLRRRQQRPLRSAVLSPERAIAAEILMMQMRQQQAEGHGGGAAAADKGLE